MKTLWDIACGPDRLFELARCCEFGTPRERSIYNLLFLIVFLYLVLFSGNILSLAWHYAFFLIPYLICYLLRYLLPVFTILGVD